jgi:hypothetical protein
MGNPVRVQISPRAPRGSPSREGGDPSYFLGLGLLAAALGAGSRGWWFRDDAHEADGEPILCLDFVLGAAVLAPHVGAAGILAEVKDLGWAEQLRTSNALDRGIADELGGFGHGIPSGIDLGLRGSGGIAPVITGPIVGTRASIVQRGAWARP